MERPGADPIHSSSTTELFYLSACGDDARRWLAELEESENCNLRLDLSKALRNFRAQQIHPGLVLMESAVRRLRTQEGRSPAIERFLWRYVYSAQAYLEYLKSW